MSPEVVQPEERCPISGTHSRLHQAHLAWHQAQRDYQNPDGFCVNLNATVQSLRSVTFVLQKEKGEVPDFEPWYEAWRERLKADPLMRWLIEARNRVEKQGDLETASTARISVLANWDGPVVVAEVTMSPLLTAEEIVQQLPDLGLPAEVQKDGLLLIERRWVVKDLPDRELLEVLAHCYGVLATLVVDAHRQCGFAMRTFRGDSHEPRPVRTEHLEGRLPCMVATADTRTATLHLGEGRFVESRQLRFDADPKYKDQSLARYGATAGELALGPGEGAIEASSRYFEMAKRVLARDGYHIPMAHLIDQDGQLEFQALHLEDRQSLYLAMRHVADQVQRIGAVAVIYTAEAWFADPADLKPGQRPSEVPTRRELLQVTAATSDGRRRFHAVEFSKNTEGKIEFGKSTVSDVTDGPWDFLEPIRQVWKEWSGWKGSDQT